MPEENQENINQQDPNQESDSNQDQAEEPKKKKRRFGLFYKLMGITFGLIVLIPLSLYFLSMNEGFREWAIQQILGYVNEGLEGKIEVGDIDFFDPEGIRFEEVVVHAGGDTLANIPDMLVDIKARDLFDNKVLANRIELNGARIKLIRDMEGLWNFSKISTPANDTVQDTTASTPWRINVDKLVLNNSMFMFRDSTQLYDSLGNSMMKESYTSMNYADFRLMGLNLKSRDIEVLTGENKYQIDISRLSYNDLKSKAKLDKLSGEFALNEQGIFAEAVEIEIDDAKIDFTGAVAQYNVFAGQDFNTALLKLDLEADEIDGYEVEAYAPMPIKLSQNADLSINAQGRLDSIDIEAINLDFGNSELLLEGLLTDVTKPDEFVYDVTIQNSNVTRSDIRKIQGLDLSSIPDFGNGRIRKFEVKGTTGRVKGYADISTKIGDIRGTLKSNWAGTISYSFNGDIDNLDLANLTGDSSMSSDLSGSLKASGSGTDLPRMSGQIDFTGGFNRFLEYTVDEINLQAEIKDGIAELEDLTIIRYDRGGDPTLPENDLLELSGTVDFGNMDNPTYSLDANVEALDLRSLLGSSKLPSYLSGNFTLEGSGLDPEDLLGSIEGSMDLILFEDRALLPFDFSLDFEKTDSGRLLSFQSDFMEFYIDGDYSYQALIETVQIHATELAGYAQRQLNKIITSTQHIDEGVEEEGDAYLSTFPQLDARLYGTIQDLSPISIFIDSTNLSSTINIGMRLANIDTRSVLTIDSINIDELTIDRKDFQMSTDELFLSGDLRMELENNHPIFESFKLNTDAREPIEINENTFYNAYLYSQLDNDTLAISTHIDMNNQFDLSLIGQMFVQKDLLDMELSVLEVGYDSLHIWKNISDIQARFGERGFYVDSLKLQRKDKEIITINGAYDAETDKFDEVNVTVTQFDINYLTEIVPGVNNQYLEYTSGKVDTLGIHIDGTMTNPNVELLFRTNDVNFNGTELGSIYADISHKDDIISGLISTEKSDEKIDNYKIKINSIPYSLTLDSIENRWHKRAPIDIDIAIDSLSMAVVDPFVDAIQRSEGYINLKANITGQSPEDYDIEGKVDFNDLSTTVLPINIRFNSTGELTFDKEKIVFNKFEFGNPNDILAGSKAYVTGEIQLEDFVPSELDLKVDVDRLKVLSDRTKETMRNIYGDLVISTGRDPFVIKGTLSSPRISGDLEVLQSNLTLPLEESSQAAEAKFNYYWEGEDIYIVYLDEEGENKDEENTGGSSTYRAMGLDFRVFFPADLVVNISINQLMSLEAHIGTKYRGGNILFKKEPNSEEARLVNDIYLQEQSILNFAGRKFETSGSLSFPYGLSNPTMDISAVYEGRMSSTQNSQDFTVTINVNGTKEDPTITYGYTIGGDVNPNRRENSLDDVLSLILLGALPGGGGGEESLGSELGNSATTTVLNPAIRELLGEIAGKLSFLQLDVTNRGGGIDNTMVQLRGKLIDGVYVTGGGSLYGGEITIEVPLAELLDDDSLANLRLQFTQYFNDISNNATTRERINTELKLKWAKTW